MTDVTDAPLLVACLCAEWCGTCRAYRETLAQLAQRFAGRARCVYVDIEDEAEVAGDLDIENFPTLLIARGDTPLFYGTVLPHLGHAASLIERAERNELPPVQAPEALGLPARVRAFADAA